MTPVLFGGHTDPPQWRPFSNFYPASFIIDGVEWPTTEHYYQAMKAFMPEDPENVRQCPTPWQAKKLGSAIPLRPDWEEIKYEVMLVALLAKFTQNPKLGQLLLSTEDRVIHENRPDLHWGGGPNYLTGRDLLGKALMRVRSVLRAG
jgi:N-glycosidase YbiA